MKTHHNSHDESRYAINKTQSEKIILDLCGGTGSWSAPYRQAGYDVRNVTLPSYNILEWRNSNIASLIIENKIYGILCVPPCQMFSFARTNAKKDRNLYEGMKIVKACLEIIYQVQYKIVSNNAKYTHLKFWCLENPFFGLLKNFIGKPVFVFDPWEFGDMYKKRTALWGNFNIPQKTVFNVKGQLKKFDSLLMGELNQLSDGNYLKQLDESGVIDRDLTVMEQMVTLTNQGYPEYSRWIFLNLTSGLVGDRYGLGFDIGFESIFESERNVTDLVARQRFVSGMD